jgi:hypothetical protein
VNNSSASSLLPSPPAPPARGIPHPKLLLPPPNQATPAPPPKLDRRRRSPLLLLPRNPCLHPRLCIEVRSLHPSKSKRPRARSTHRHSSAERRPPQGRDASAVARATSLNLWMSSPYPQLCVGANRVQNHALELFFELRRRALRRTLPCAAVAGAPAASREPVGVARHQKWRGQPRFTRDPSQSSRVPVNRGIFAKTPALF